MKKEEVKQPKKRMTADEVMAHVFHPKVAEHLRKHVENLSGEKEKPKK
jgi:hypothetical protein